MRYSAFKTLFFAASFLVVCLLFPTYAYAYVGPGAGFAFLGSAFVFIITLVMALVTFAFWPLQYIWKKISKKGIRKNARTKRVIIVGLDGLDPNLVRKYVSAGMLPNFSLLAEKGGFRELKTTIPSISPVAWSSFQTGVNPGAHNIFDFLTRDKRTYLPRLSSTDTLGATKSVNVGKYSIPISMPRVELKRKSKTFWKILGDEGIFCNILRVPISYPPEKVNGNVLAAMCAPDLKGSQGTYSYYTTDENRVSSQVTGGELHLLRNNGNGFTSELYGPPNPFKTDGSLLKAPFSIKRVDGSAEVLLTIGRTKLTLKLDEFSPWIEVVFKFGVGQKLSGICRFLLRKIDSHTELYVSPLNINPLKPALPISSPSYFSSYLSRVQGLFGTLGLLEDTWALNNGALSEKNFIDQVYLMHEEREAMFFNLLKKTRQGVIACVFDASDRIQHMFWRHLENNGSGANGLSNVIPDMYKKMDDLVGRVQAKIGEGDVLIVMSDHGFTAFKREFNINSWLRQENYLVVKENFPDSQTEYLQNVDWSKTKVFGIGLGGLFFNRIGREQQGIVNEVEAVRLKDEILKKLKALHDPNTGRLVIKNVYDTSECYKGIYREDGPDLIIGCEPGYRIGWGSVTGQSGEEIFSDNDKAWSGDHCVDPACVPGVFFSNKTITSEIVEMIDIAPTVLDLFAVKPPGYMEGKVVL